MRTVSDRRALAGRALATGALVTAGAAELGCALVVNRVRRREAPAAVAAHVASRTLERLGPTYVKLGQILATRRDLLPAEVAARLERLQDRLEPAPFETVPARFRAETGLDLHEVFAELDPRPLASASIASVHRASLRDGTPVAVKVRRPGVARAIDLDVRLIRGAARLASRLPGLRGLPLLAALDEFDACLLRQVDLRLEADAGRRVWSALADHPRIVVPAIVDGLSTESFLVMELLELDRTARGPESRQALVAALRALYQLIFLEGLVHCDLHGGNLFLLPGGEAALVDFGFVAELPESVRIRFAEFFLGLATNDGPRCARITVETAAFVPPTLDYARFEAEVGELVSRAANAVVADFRVADFVLGLFDVQRRHRIVGTSAFTMAIVALLVFEGVANEIAGDLDFKREAVPFVLRALAQAHAGAEPGEPREALAAR